MSTEEILTFFFEMGHLSRVKREGWRLLGVEHPESVADHSLRAAQIGWVLAVMEGYSNPHEVAAMLIFHDMTETRIGDIHKLANRYLTTNHTRALEEQSERLGAAGKPLQELWHNAESRTTQAAIIAKDADLVELAVRAREYLEQGFSAAQEWFDGAQQRVKTDSARALIAKLPSVSATSWWHGLKKFNDQ